MVIKKFSDWRVGKAKGQSLDFLLAQYMRMELFQTRHYRPHYPAEQAKLDFDEALAKLLDEFAATVDKRILKPSLVPKPKETQTGAGTGKGNSSSGKGNSSSGKGKEGSPTDSGPTQKTSGSGTKSFENTKEPEEEGNTIVQKKEKPAPYNDKIEFGNIELREVFLRMPKNPDLVLKADTEKAIDSDVNQWGVVRPSRVMNIATDNLEEFRRAEPKTPWLGFIRIGRRVDREEDKIALIQIVQSVGPGLKYAVPTKELKAGESWHATWLHEKFAKQGDPKIKDWNGWDLQALKKHKTLDLADTGCFFGFFLIKAPDNKPDHYFNFRCASLNQPANAVFSDHTPDVPRAKMSREQLTAFYNLVESARSGFSPRLDEIKTLFPNTKLHRAALELENASKKVPLSWAKALVQTIQKF